MTRHAERRRTKRLAERRARNIPKTSDESEKSVKLRSVHPELVRIFGSIVRFGHSIAPHLSGRELTRARASPTGTFTAGELVWVSAWALHAAWQSALASA